MQGQTTGTIISAKKQWWMKVNQKPIRTGGPLDGAAFPYIVKVRYTVNGTEYTKRKWIGTGHPVPVVGNTLSLAYDMDRPERVKIVW
jgi:hypothetical protein